LGLALIVVFLLVLQPIISGTQQGTTTTSNAYTAQVTNAYATHVALLSARKAATVADGYESNATIDWTGAVGDMVGTYSGAGNIAVLWASTIGSLKNFSMSSEHESIGVGTGGTYVVNSTLDLLGWEYCNPSSGVSGVASLNGTVIAQDVYQHVSNGNSSSWLIVRETWNFAQFDEPKLGSGCIPFPSHP
jgi:hypothetical protein